MAITQGRSGQRIFKNFLVSGEWTPLLASIIDEYLTQLTTIIPPVRYGRYVGNGESKTVYYSPGDGPPLIVWIVNETTGVIVTTMVVLEAGPITAWGKESFTVNTSSSVNTNGQGYQFLALLQPTG